MMIRKCIIPISEVEQNLKSIVLNNLHTPKKNKCKTGSSIMATFDGEKIYVLSKRYKTFFTSGYKCVHCGIEGKYFALERHENNKKYHLNLYGLDAEGNEVLMTKDHIIPHAKGGSDDYTNMQTMCAICNFKKGTMSDEQFKKEAKR